ncbi:MAG TPA: MFS transporter [Sphingomonas sp.]|nr:MFS transporter [Sphingomonas sp.]
MYCVQPLLPLFAETFHVAAVEASLALSLTTGMVAIAIVVAAVVSERVGRRGLRFVSIALAALLNLAAALLPGWRDLLAARAIEGLALGGVPAVAMAYLAEEIAPEGLGQAMGLYIGGTAFGGMMGRVGVGLLADVLSWRAALALVSGIDLAAAIGFVLLAPPSRHFVARRGFDARYHLAAWKRHLLDGRLALLFAVGFLVMGAFVTIYNYVGFRLLKPPFSLSQGELGLLFLVYLFGIVASSLAGTLADKIGRARVLAGGFVIAMAGAALTLAGSLPLLILGVAVLTVGFFATHSLASGWVGREARAAKGHASSLYLLAYYLGSSVAGSAGGWFWARGGWSWVVGFTLALLALGLIATTRLGRSEREWRPRQGSNLRHSA